MVMNGLIAWSGLTVGNFIYQAIKNKNWQVATERSFFQGVAIGMFIFIS